MVFLRSNNKRIYLIFLLMSIFLVSNAQKRNLFLHYQEVDSKKFHFGFSLGLNYMDYNFRFNANPGIRADVVKVKPGFSVGAIAEYKLNKDFALRALPGLEFGSRSVTFVHGGKKDGNFESIYIDLPLLLKYKAKRLKNARPYFVSGFGMKYDIQSKKKYEPAGNIFIRTLPMDFYYQLGFGIDWYFPYFKWSTELKFAIGLMDIIDHTIDKKAPGYAPIVDSYTKSISRMNSKVVSLVFHFE